VTDKETNQAPFLLANLPPSQAQIRLALCIVAFLLIAFVITAPFASIQMQRVDAFIPALESALIVGDLITAALLFAQFSIARRWALLGLAIGFLFTALIIIPHVLTFPGAFAPTGLLGAGFQSTAWIYYFWKAGLPLAVIFYVLCKDADSETSISQRSLEAVIGSSVIVVIAIVCGLTWIATAGDFLLPKIFIDSVRGTPVTSYLVGGFTMSLVAAALLLLWFRRRSVLDLWLMVMCSTLLLEIVMTCILVNIRFTLGWYASRFFGLSAAIVVLLVLLSETTTLYANLARSMMRRNAAREARQIAMDAMAASISHEVKQPLGAMVTSANAGLRWLTNATPNLDEVHACLTRIVDDGHRMNEVIGGIRSMYKKDARGRQLLDTNNLVRDVLTMADLDIRNREVSVTTGLRKGLPQLLADRGQLQQVFLNLIMNAIDAMGSVTGRARVLQVNSDLFQESSGVVVITVEDTGTGITSEDKDRIFDPFFTTKSAGIGIGLSICRSIIESHGGSLQASANKPYGAIFRVTLPSGQL
jgi:signal transduction histidine kinase